MCCLINTNNITGKNYEFWQRYDLNHITFTWLHGLNSRNLAEIAWCPRRILHLQNIQHEYAGIYVARVKFPDGTVHTSAPTFLVVRTTSFYG